MGIPNDVSLVNLNNSYIFKGFYPQGIIDQFIRKIPFHRLDKPTTVVSWNRPKINTLVTVPVYARGADVDSTPQDFELTTRTMQRIGATALVDDFSQAVSGNPNNLLEAEIQAKKIAIIRTLGAQIFVGSGAENNFNGLKSEVIPSQEFSLTGNPLLPTDKNLLQLINMVRASDGAVGGGADCLVTNERVIRYIVAQGLASGRNCETIYDADLGVAVPLFCGIPMYAGQVPTDDPEDPGIGHYDIWAVKLSGPTGIRVLHATGRSDQFGIDVTPISTQVSKAQSGAFVGGLYCLMVPEPQSIARIKMVYEGDLLENGILVLPVPT